MRGKMSSVLSLRMKTEYFPKMKNSRGSHRHNMNRTACGKRRIFGIAQVIAKADYSQSPPVRGNIWPVMKLLQPDNR